MPLTNYIVGPRSRIWEPSSEPGAGHPPNVHPSPIKPTVSTKPRMTNWTSFVCMHVDAHGSMFNPITLPTVALALPNQGCSCSSDLIANRHTLFSSQGIHRTTRQSTASALLDSSSFAAFDVHAALGLKSTGPGQGQWAITGYRGKAGGGGAGVASRRL